MKQFKLFVVSFAILGCFACGGSSTAPTPVTPVPANVMAPPPSGMSATGWLLGFFSDSRLHYPKGAVHIALPTGLSDTTKNLFVTYVGEVAGSLNGQTPMDTIADSTGANFVASINPGLNCGGVANAVACTRFNLDSSTGEVLGGTIEFISEAAMRDRVVAKHELYRTLGISRNGELPGIMSPNPSTSNPSSEELTMFLARKNYPLLAVYTDH